jgi:hypothetical protein
MYIVLFVEVVLRHFHRCRYRSSTAVILLLEGRRSLGKLAIRKYSGSVVKSLRHLTRQEGGNSTGLTVPSYFSDRWGRNLRGQTTIRRCGASAMHPPLTPGELGGYASRVDGLLRDGA